MDRLPLRLPWAQSETAFTAACTRCGECVRICPERIITSGDSGFPEIDFRRGACSFCGDCAAVCEPAALKRLPGRPPWAIVARIVDGKCLSVNGVTCRVCGDLCEAGAIRFNPVLGGSARVTLDQGACTGCGECVASCPADAVEILHIDAAQAATGVRP